MLRHWCYSFDHMGALVSKLYHLLFQSLAVLGAVMGPTLYMIVYWLLALHTYSNHSCILGGIEHLFTDCVTGYRPR